MSRRQDVVMFQARQAQHAGLWLDKYLQGSEQGGGADVTPKAQLVTEVTAIPTPDAYRQFYQSWKTSLELAGVKDAYMKKAHVQGRLAVGLGGEAVLETAITLHRTFGVPYIPGSALKGLASSYAHKRLEGDTWRKGGKAHNIMFGTTDEAGYVTFFDALYVPDTGHDGKALWPDVITVHHPEYYQGTDPPADWDNPTPIPFLTATGSYLIALQGDDAWVDKAFDILELALAEEGVGAKTSSGYGRMAFGETSDGPTDTKKTYELAKLRLLRQETPQPARFRGDIASVHSSHDYGWINPAGGGQSLFVHVSQLRPQGSQLREGQIVEYSKGLHRGQEQAQQVDVLLEPS